MLQTFEEDSELCCNHALTEAAEADPELKSFECPQCGMVWRPKIYSGAVKHWSQYPTIEMLRL
jgi:predicted RNA-binding Zn-ribbon protein involved in translation (DUF1610 family)